MSAPRRASGPAALVPTEAFEDPRLGKTELRVLGLVCSYAARRSRKAWMGMETLAERLDLHPRSVQKACKKLYDLDYLDRYTIPLSGGSYRFGYVVQHDPSLDERTTETVGLSSTLTRERQSGDERTTETGRENDVAAVILSGANPQVAAKETAPRTELTEVEQRDKSFPTPMPSASDSEPRGTCPVCGERATGSCGRAPCRGAKVIPDPEPLEAWGEAVAHDEEVASRE